MHDTAPFVINVTSKQRLPPAARAHLHKHKHQHEFDSCSVTHSKKRQGTTFSDHAMQRAQQRRITRAHVDECRADGVAEFEQGFKGVRILHRLHGLCVVSCAKTGHVITQWWEGDALAEACVAVAGEGGISPRLEGVIKNGLGRHARRGRCAHVRALRSQDNAAVTGERRGRYAHVRALRSQEKEAYHHGPRVH